MRLLLLVLLALTIPTTVRADEGYLVAADVHPMEPPRSRAESYDCAPPDLEGPDESMAFLVEQVEIDPDGSGGWPFARTLPRCIAMDAGSLFCPGQSFCWPGTEICVPGSFCVPTSARASYNVTSGGYHATLHGGGAEETRIGGNSSIGLKTNCSGCPPPWIVKP